MKTKNQKQEEAFLVVENDINITHNFLRICIVSSIQFEYSMELTRKSNLFKFVQIKIYILKSLVSVQWIWLIVQKYDFLD